MATSSSTGRGADAQPGAVAATTVPELLDDAGEHQSALRGS